MLDELFDHFEGHRGDVSAHARRLDNMNGVSTSIINYG